MPSSPGLVIHTHSATLIYRMYAESVVWWVGRVLNKNCGNLNMNIQKYLFCKETLHEFCITGVQIRHVVSLSLQF